MTDKEIEEILEEYGDISNYIGEQVYQYKKETTKLMDKLKYIFFAYLIANETNKVFKDKIQKEFNNYQLKIDKKTINDLKQIKDIMNYTNKPIYTSDIKLEVQNIVEMLKLDKKSIKTANDRYIRVLENYYNKFKKTLEKEWIQEEAYLSSKVSKFDKVEKSVVYNNPRAKDGKAYFDIASYDSMVYNTNLTNQAWLTTIDGAEKIGNDLVYVPAHPYSCELCMEWQGKIYSLTGSTPEYTNLDIALFGGLKHPNCKHPILNYWGQKETNEYTGEEWQEKYDARQKKQALELKKSRLLSDNKIYKELGDLEAVDKNNSKIRKINSKIREQKELM